MPEPATVATPAFYNGQVVDTTTKLRLLLANVIADAGALRDGVSSDVREPVDLTYLLREIDRLQATAHRIGAILDHDLIDTPRQ